MTIARFGSMAANSSWGVWAASRLALMALTTESSG